jgi:3'-phosphoadenosine 5'-phosphosulfate sulfotransferase (PAPS reductase)/FAD synthetase
VPQDSRCGEDPAAADRERAFKLRRTLGHLSAPAMENRQFCYHDLVVNHLTGRLRQFNAKLLTVNTEPLFSTVIFCIKERKTRLNLPLEFYTPNRRNGNATSRPPAHLSEPATDGLQAPATFRCRYPQFGEPLQSTNYDVA